MTAAGKSSRRLKAAPQSAQPRRPAGSSDGGRYAPTAVADPPPPGAHLRFRSIPKQASRNNDEAPPGAPIPAGPLKLRIVSVPDRAVKRRQTTITRPGPGGLWENHTPFAQPFIRAIRNEWGTDEAALDLQAQVAVDLLNSGDADPNEPECMQAVRFGVGQALLSWKAGDGWWDGPWLCRSGPDPFMRRKGMKWGPTAMAAAARTDRYLAERLGPERARSPHHPALETFSGAWGEVSFFDSEAFWRGADGRLLERLADNRAADGSDSLFRQDPRRPRPEHIGRHRDCRVLEACLALAVLGLDPPPCPRVRDEARQKAVTLCSGSYTTSETGVTLLRYLGGGRHSRVGEIDWNALNAACEDAMKWNSPTRSYDFRLFADECRQLAPAGGQPPPGRGI